MALFTVEDEEEESLTAWTDVFGCRYIEIKYHHHWQATAHTDRCKSINVNSLTIWYLRHPFKPSS
jgi:hypothetical protein